MQDLEPQRYIESDSPWHIVGGECNRADPLDHWKELPVCTSRIYAAPDVLRFLPRLRCALMVSAWLRYAFARLHRFSATSGSGAVRDIRSALSACLRKNLTSL